jgi:hypothetical protein
MKINLKIMRVISSKRGMALNMKNMKSKIGGSMIKPPRWVAKG